MKVHLNTMMSMAAKFLESVQKTLSYYDEVDKSPPRAQIALVTARFEERLDDEIIRRLAKLQGTSSSEKLQQKEKRAIVQMIPRSVSKKIEFGYALGIFPHSTLADLRRVFKLRNRAVHKTEPLNSGTKTELEEGVVFLRIMEFYLANVGSHDPKDGPYPPPGWQDAKDYLLGKR